MPVGTPDSAPPSGGGVGRSPGSAGARPAGRSSFTRTLWRRFLGQSVSQAAGYAIGGAIQPVLEPFTQSSANAFWALHPARPLAATTAARASAEGIVGTTAATDEASMTGFDEGRFATLRALAQDYPPSDTLLELLRRGDASPEQVDEALARHAIPKAWRDRMQRLRWTLASPSDLIRMAVREVFTPGLRDELRLFDEFPEAFADEAAKLGIDREQARWHWGAHWQLPSYEQAVEMLHRGELTAAEFSNLLRALDYAPVWRSKMEAIARRIPPISDVIRFAVRDAYDDQAVSEFRLDDELPAQFIADAALHGQDERASRLYWRAHWRPPSAIQAFRMRHRGVISDAQLDRLLKVQDYAPFWRDKLKQITYLVPGRIDLRRMYAAGIIDRDGVKTGYERLGYAPADAETLTEFAVHLAQAGGTADPWADRARSRLYTVTHDEYLDESITETTAREMLAQVGAAGVELDRVIELWKLEASIARLELTPAQIKKAYTKDRYTFDTARSELMERGMTQQDAEDFLES